MKKERLKVAIIGGGSSYTPELVDGFIQNHRHFPPLELVLADIEEGKEKLEIVGGLARRMIERAQAPIRLKLTLDRKEAIAGADFVLTQIRVGLLDARSRDEKIPLKYGCIGQETTGAGGFAKALRTIPVILDICRDMERLSPNAFLINFTNPAGVVTEAALKHSSVRAVGLCNLPINLRMQIAKRFGVHVSEVDAEWVGINHLNWTMRVFVRGEEATEEAIFRAARANGQTVANIPEFDWDETFLRSVGGLPCPYLRYYYQKDRMLADQLERFRQNGTTRADDVKRVEAGLFELYKNPNLSEKPKKLEERGGAYYSEAAVQLIRSLCNHSRDIQTVNVRNGKTLPFLPEDAVVEANCVIDSAGAHPIRISAEIPPQVRGLLQIVKAYEELTVKAAVDGDYNAALQALTIHPLVGTADLAKRILHDILEQNRAYLPQFF